jgi:hypothetical protein
VTFVDGEQIAATAPYTILERGAWKVGIISIAEYDWISTLSLFDPEDLHYEDIVECTEHWGQKLSKGWFLILRRGPWL